MRNVAAVRGVTVLRMLRWLRQLFGLVPGDAGARGEAQAAEWLRRERGFRLIARNWRNPADRREEIDLVARDGEVLVFVEVKTRAAGARVPGFYAVDERKRRVLRRAIDAYLRRLGADAPRTFRFDVVEVSHAEAAPAGVAEPTSEILHFANVPLFPKHYRR